MKNFTFLKRTKKKCSCIMPTSTLRAEVLRSSCLGRSKGLCSQGSRPEKINVRVMTSQYELYSNKRPEFTFAQSNIFLQSIIYPTKKTIPWRAASLSDRNMGENLSPIWPGSHCLNSAKHRPLTAWNHTWGEMGISFRDLLLKLYSTYLSTDHFSRHYRVGL